MKATVVIPTYNRAAALAACLSALAGSQEQDFEIIVVDDGGSVELESVVAPFEPRARLIRKDNGGPAKARNEGARHARGDFIAFTDDDCRPEPGWLAAFLRSHAKHPKALVGGHVKNVLVENIYATASQSLCDFLYSYYRADEGEAAFFTSNNTGCARDLFLALGGFNESFPIPAAEDRDLGMRWRAAGRPLVYVPDAIVGHGHAMRFWGFWRQHQNYGRGACHLHRVMRARGEDRPKIEGKGFYLGLLAHPFAAGEPSPLQQSVLLALSQIAMVSGYFLELRNSPPERDTSIAGLAPTAQTAASSQPEAGHLRPYRPFDH